MVDRSVDYRTVSVHSPRITKERAQDFPPDHSWWAEVEPDHFYEEAREQFRARLSRSTRATGQRGIDG